MRTATGAVRRPTIPPPNGWPRIWAEDWLIWSLELPSTSSSRSRIVGRYDWSATSKNTVMSPFTNPTTYSCQIVRPPNAYAIGIDTSIAARPRSPMTRIRRFGKRSTHTPAGNVNRRKGRNSIVVSRPTSPAEAFSSTAAMNGIAIWLTWVPNSETVAAVQRRA